MAARVASSLLAAAALCATSHASAIVDTTVAAVTVAEVVTTTSTAPTCYDTVFDVSSDDAIATAWSITPGENGGYFRHNRHRNRESGGVLVLRNGLDARRGGAAGDSYITASFPHAGSDALVSATIEGGTLRTADDACTFSASGDNGATWTEVVQVDRDDGPATAYAVIPVPAGEIIFKFQIDSDGKREKCYLADARASCQPEN
jgi:hypothetical protein